MGDLSGLTREQLLRRQQELVDAMRTAIDNNLPLDPTAADAVGQELADLNSILSSGDQPTAPAPGPMTPDTVFNPATFQPVPAESAAEPEVDQDLPPTRADGGDQLRSDSVIPDLGWKAPKAPLTEAEATTGAAESRGAATHSPSEGPIGDIRTSPGERPPTSDLPRTQERPGTATSDPRPERPEGASRERPTGQITDDSGEYGPERTWYSGDGETDWNKMNRAPAKRAMPKAAYVAVAAAVVGLGLVLLRAGQAAPPAPSSSAPVQGGSFGLGPLKVTRGPNSTISLYQLESAALPSAGKTVWTIDAPCGSIAATQFSAQVSWSSADNTKTCPPGTAGPFAGTVKVVFTAADGKTYSWNAGSESGTFGERVTLK